MIYQIVMEMEMEIPRPAHEPREPCGTPLPLTPIVFVMRVRGAVTPATSLDVALVFLQRNVAPVVDSGAHVAFVRGRRKCLHTTERGMSCM